MTGGRAEPATGSPASAHPGWSEAGVRRAGRPGHKQSGQPAGRASATGPGQQPGLGKGEMKTRATCNLRPSVTSTCSLVSPVVVTAFHPTDVSQQMPTCFSSPAAWTLQPAGASAAPPAPPGRLMLLLTSFCAKEVNPLIFHTPI